MFPQFCRYGPKRLWDKIYSKQTDASADEHIAAGDCRLGETKTYPRDEDSSCQLEHCTFCDYRVCCQVTHLNKELQDSKYLETNFDATENPAYGISSKNGLASKGKRNKEEDVKNNMEFSSKDAGRRKDTAAANSLPNTNLDPKENSTTSQQTANCDDDNKMSMKSFSASNHPDSKISQIDPSNGLTWSILKHRQLNGDASTANCDNNKAEYCVIERSVCKTIPELESTEHETEEDSEQKLNSKDRSFPLTKPVVTTVDKKMGPIGKTDLSRQRPVQKPKTVPAANRTPMTDPPCKGTDPLSAIEKIKTEESIQEWLARINESTNAGLQASEENHKPWSLNRSTANNAATSKAKLLTETTHFLNQALQEALEISHKSYSEPSCSPDYGDYQEDELTDTVGLLCNASKASPANIPMVVMQCSRLHSHIGSKPPFQQTSLPMGTLITALYQESDWLYVQTPHGVEGFIVASNCVPIGTSNDSPHTSRRPWEPCDFPIEINVKRRIDFGRQQGTYISAKLPTHGHKPFVSTVKMKTNFYSDRYFSHTFKSKDSIKTAKTVTDILRNSPETKVSN